VEVNIVMSIMMHFYTGEVQNTVFHKDQYKIPYIFYLYKWLLKNYSWKI